MTAVLYNLERKVYVDKVLRDDARVIDITRMRDKMMQTARIEFFPKYSAETGRFHNTSFQQLLPNSLVEIKVTIKGSSYTYHIGKIGAGGGGFDETSEVLTAESRLDEHLFGIPSSEFFYAGRPKEDQEKLDKWIYFAEDYPLIFNPIFDGRRQGNQFAQENDGKLALINLDSIPRFSTTVFNKLWTLRTAARFLCQELNHNETYIANPVKSDFDTLPDEEGQLTNLSIGRGTYLPSALEKLLGDYGYYSKLNMPNDFTGVKKPFITFHKRNTDDTIKIKGQRKGARLNVNENQAIGVHVGFEMVSESAQRISAKGARPTFESTFELVPGWSDLYDSTTAFSDLMLNSTWSRVSPGGERVWRTWVLNESNDYQVIREYLKPFDVSEFVDDENKRFFTGLRRRPFRPTLSGYEDHTLTGIHNGVFVEFSIDGGETWHSISGSDAKETTIRRGLSDPSIKLLKKEAGIQFTGTLPPRELIAAGLDENGRPKAKIRVTATIEGDVPILGSKDDPKHPLTDMNEMLIDVSRKYRYDSIQTKSEFKDFVDKKLGSSREIDNRKDLEMFVEDLIANWGHPTQNGVITLFKEGGVLVPTKTGTLDISECLGLGVEKITNRELSFALNSDGSRFPNIEAITHDFIKSETRLEFKTYRGVI